MRAADLLHDSPQAPSTLTPIEGTSCYPLQQACRVQRKFRIMDKHSTGVCQGAKKRIGEALQLGRVIKRIQCVKVQMRHASWIWHPELLRLASFPEGMGTFCSLSSQRQFFYAI